MLSADALRRHAGERAHRRGHSAESWGSMEEVPLGGGPGTAPALPLLHSGSLGTAQVEEVQAVMESPGMRVLEHAVTSPEGIASLLEEGGVSPSGPTSAQPTPLACHRRSVSANPDADGRAKTSLVKLIISGPTLNGNRLTAKGVQRGGKRCLFQWSVLPAGATDWQTLRSARRPELRVTLADLGACFRCDATPVAEDGSHGVARCAFSQPVGFNETLGMELKEARATKLTAGPLRFAVKMKDNDSEPPTDMLTVLCLSARAATVHVCVQEDTGADCTLGVEIIRIPLLSNSLATSGRPHVVMVLERFSARFKLGTCSRGQLFEASSQEEQERIAVALKMVHPAALVTAADYRVPEPSLASPTSVRSLHVSAERPLVHDAPADMMATLSNTVANTGPRKVGAGYIPRSGGSGDIDSWQQYAMSPPHKAAKFGVSPATSTPAPQTPLQLHPKGRGQLSADDADSFSSALSAPGSWRGTVQEQLQESLETAWVRARPGYNPRSSKGNGLSDSGIMQGRDAPYRANSAISSEASGSPISTALSGIHGAAQSASRPHPPPASETGGTHSRRSTRTSADYSTLGLPCVQGLHLAGRPLVGSIISAQGFSSTTQPLFQWQRTLTVASGGDEALQPGSSRHSRKANLEVQTIPGATGASYQVTPDDLGAIIQVCCIPVDASGLKGLTTYACLPESKPVELPADLESELATYKAIGTANFQVKRGDGQGSISESCTLHLDPKACYLKSRSGRVVAKEKYLPGDVSVQIPSVPRMATIIITRPAAPNVAWKLTFKSQHERDAAVLLIHSFAESLRNAGAKKKGFFSFSRKSASGVQ